MKKALIILLVLAVAGGAFGQTFNWSGNFQSGFGIQIPDEGDALIRMQGNTYDFINRLDLNLNAANADNAAGFDGVLRWNNITGGEGFTPVVERANLWMDVSDGMIRLSAGRGGPGGFGAGGSMNPSFDLAAGDRNVSATVFATDELRLGFTIRPRATASPLDEIQYIFGARYDITGTARIVGLFQYNNKAINLAAGVDIFALADMGLTKLGLDVQFLDATQENADMSEIRLSQAITYTAPTSLQIGLTLREILQIGDAAREFPLMRFTGWVQYPTGIFTPRLDFGVSINTDPNLNYRKPGDFLRDNQHGDDNVTAEDTMAIAFSPNLGINLGGGASLEIGYTFGMNLETEVMCNSIYLNMRVNF